MRRALCAANAAIGGKPINIISLYPEIDEMNTLNITFDFSYIPTSDIYITLETTGLLSSMSIYLSSEIKNGIKTDVDIGCSTNYIKVIEYTPMEDDNFVYQIKII